MRSQASSLRTSAPSGRSHPLPRLDPILGGSCSKVDRPHPVLLNTHLLVDGVLEFIVTPVLDGKACLLPVIDDDAAEVDVIYGADGESRVHRLGTDADWDVSD